MPARKKVRDRKTSPRAAVPGPRWERAVPAALAVLFLAALALRAVLAWRNDYPSVDGAFYMDQARWILTQGQLPLRGFPPGWPLLIVPPLALFDIADPMAPLRAAQLVNVLLGTLLGWLVWRILREEFDRRYALAGAAIALFLPQLILASVGDMSEPSYACAVAVAWLLLRRGRALGAGALLGAAYLIRPEALVIAAALFVHALVRDRKVPWRLALGVAVGVVPYMLFLFAKTGSWQLTLKGGTVVEAAELSPGGSALGLLAANARNHLPHLARMLGLPVVLLAIVGAVKRPGRWLYFVIPGFAPLLFTFAMSARFWLPTVPFLLIGTGRGGTWLLRRFLAGARPRTAVLTGLLLMLSVGVAGLDEYPKLGDVDEAFAGQKEAGLWLRGRVEPTTLVSAYKPFASFWAGCGFEQIPVGMGAKRLAAYCRERGVRYLVLDVFTTLQLRKELSQLLQRPLPPELASDYSLVRLLSHPEDYRLNTAVYRIKSGAGG